MYDGSLKCVEDVAVGDLLMGPDSTPRKVLNLFRGVEQMYEIEQNKGITYKVNGNHILSLKDRLKRPIRKQINNKRTIIDYCNYKTTPVNIKVTDLLQKSETFKYWHKGYKSGLIKFSEKNINIDPYFLGLWLGDGAKANLRITTIDEEIKDFIYDYSNKLNLKVSISGGGIKNYLINKGKNKTNVLLDSFKIHKLINNKHIPDSFLYNTEENRLELLAGLLDTDGSYDFKRNCFEITQKNNGLSNQITFLARSLGFYVSINKSKRKISSINFEGVYNRILIFGDLNRIPTKINRKKAKVSTRNSDWLVTGIKVNKGKKDNYYGFQLDKDNLFLLEDFTVTHNSGKSTLLNEFGREYIPKWDNTKAIVSHFKDPEDAINKLSAVGLNSIPSWNQPYHTLSTGEKFRADMSRKLFNGSVIDEYTSVIDRNVAKATSMALKRYLKTHDLKNIVLSTCHEDVIEYLEPDWVIDTNTGNVYDGFFLTENQSILKSISQTVQHGTCLKNIII